MIRQANAFLAVTLLFVSGCKSCCPFCETPSGLMPQFVEQWWSLLMN